MELKELNNKLFMHDEILRDIAYNKESHTLKLKLEFCEWQLDELNSTHKGYTLTFRDVEQFLSYTDMNQIIKDNNTIDFLKIKKIRGQNKNLVTFGLDHWVPTNKENNEYNWFFIEFLCEDCEVEMIK